MSELRAGPSITHVGKPVSGLSLGTWLWDDNTLEYWWAILDEFVALGGTAIDTARVYGRSEELLGEWLDRRSQRDDLVIMTKGGVWLDHDPPVDRFRDTIHDELMSSLGRLRTEYVDVYMLHRDNPGYPVGDILGPLEDEIAAGRVRALGASNWAYSRMAEAMEYADKHGMQGFSAVSNQHSLAIPSAMLGGTVVRTDDVGEEWHRRTSIPLLAWSPCGRGYFAGRYTRGPTEASAGLDDQAAREAMAASVSEDDLERLRRAEQLSREKDGATAVEICLAWLLHKPYPMIPVVGPRTLEELASCIKALSLPLTDAESAWLDLAAP